MNKIILFNISKQKLEEYEYSANILLDLYQGLVEVPSINIITTILLKKVKQNIDYKAEKIRKKIQKQISKLEDYIPLYEPTSKTIFLIFKENVYERVMFQHYRLPSKKLLETISEKNLKFINNYDLNILEITYLRVFYYYANEVGKNITECQRPSFVAELPHIKPYYSRSELINLALNMRLIEPDKSYYDIKKIEKLCPKVQENDVTSKIILEHRNFIVKNKGVHLIQHYTFNGSFSFNSYLRALPNMLYKNVIMEQNISAVWKLCSTAPAFDKKYIVYRFVDNNSFLKKLKIGDLFIDQGFTSTTRDPFYRSNFYHFGFVLIKIHLPAGKDGTALCVESFSHFPEEEEIILPPYSKLKLISKDEKFEFFHIDSNFKSNVIIKYEFEYISNSSKIVFEDKYLPLGKETDKPIDLLNITLHSPTLGSRLKEFQMNHSNKLNQFNVKIGNKVFTLIIEWYDSTSAYKNFYAVSNQNGYSIYAFYKSTILFFIEIVEALREIHVNYYFRHSDNTTLFSNIAEHDFLKFVSSLAHTFQIQKILLYSNYQFCFSASNNIQSSSNFCVDYYEYLKNNKKRFPNLTDIKSKFDYMQLDKLKTINVSSILSISDKDELYQIFLNSKHITPNTSISEFYIYIIENHCALIKTLEAKFSRIFRGLSKFNNPFLYDYYYFDPSLYLFNLKLIDVLPEIDDQITNDPEVSANLLTLEKLETATSRGLRVRV